MFHGVLSLNETNSNTEADKKRLTRDCVEVFKLKRDNSAIGYCSSFIGLGLVQYEYH